MSDDMGFNEAPLEDWQKAGKHGEWDQRNAPAPDGNDTGIRPIEFKVLIAPELTENEKRLAAMGLQAPDEAKERMTAAAMTGKIVAVSKLAFTYADDWDDDKPKIGDRVTYAKYSGMKIKGRDGEEYLMLNDKDIGSVLEF